MRSCLTSPTLRHLGRKTLAPSTSPLLLQQQSAYSSSRPLAARPQPLRRPRKKYEQFNSPKMGTDVPIVSTGLEEPLEYTPDGTSIDDYAQQKATLSPWTPVPESVARKIFDRANPTSNDIHVELGSGDGRVNFYAIEAGVQRSIGIDVDEAIVEVAQQRLQRIHPQPPLDFYVADLIDASSPNHTRAWDDVSQATILTMYFAKEGLEAIRPLLERALTGRKCQIFLCGYAMPGWDSQIVETVLDMPIYYYDWGNADVERGQDRWVSGAAGMNDDSDGSDSDMLLPASAMGMDKFAHRKKKNGASNFQPDILKGYHPDDTIDFHWDDFGIKPEGKDTKETPETTTTTEEESKTEDKQK